MANRVDHRGSAPVLKSVYFQSNTIERWYSYSMKQSPVPTAGRAALGMSK